MPLNLTPSQRKLLSRRLAELDRPLVQGPEPGQGGKIDGAKRVGGIENGALLALAAVEDLGERGNLFARRLAKRMRRDLGISGSMRVGPGMRRDELPPRPLFTVHEVSDSEKN